MDYEPKKVPYVPKIESAERVLSVTGFGTDV